MTAITMPKAVWRDREELTMFEDSVRGFFAKEAPAEACAKWRENGIVDREMWTKAGQAGLLCVSMPEEFGGGGGDFRHEAVIMDVMGTMGIDGFGLPLHNAIIAPYIKHYGSQEQKQKWLPKMASGELVGAIAMTEPGAGSDLQGIKTTSCQKRQSLCDQWFQDLHHQWCDRRFDHCRRQDRPDPRGKGYELDRG